MLYNTSPREAYLYTWIQMPAASVARHYSQQWSQQVPSGLNWIAFLQVGQACPTCGDTLPLAAELPTASYLLTMAPALYDCVGIILVDSMPILLVIDDSVHQHMLIAISITH